MSKLDWNLFKVGFLFILVLIPFLYTLLIGEIEAWFTGFTTTLSIIYIFKRFSHYGRKE